MKAYVFHREASEEYIEAVQYYSHVAPELGKRLNHEIERLITEICRGPRAIYSFQLALAASLSARISVLGSFSRSTRSRLDFRGDAWKTPTGYWRERLG